MIALTVDSDFGAQGILRNLRSSKEDARLLIRGQVNKLQKINVNGTKNFLAASKHDKNSMLYLY